MADALFFPKAKNFKRAAIVVNVVALVGFLVFIGFSIGKGVVARDHPPTTLKVEKEKPFGFPNFLVCPFEDGSFTWVDRPATFPDDDAEEDFMDPCVWAGGKKSEPVVCKLTAVTLTEIPEGEDASEADKLSCLHVEGSAAKFTDSLGSLQIFANFSLQNATNKGISFAVTSTDATAAEISASTSGYDFIQDYIGGLSGRETIVSLTKARHETLEGTKTTSYTLAASSAGDVEEGKHMFNVQFKVSSFTVQTIKETDPIGATEILGIVGGAWAYVGLIVAVFFSKTKEGEYAWRWADAKDAGGKAKALKAFGKQSVGLQAEDEAEEPTADA